MKKSIILLVVCGLLYSMNCVEEGPNAISVDTDYSPATLAYT